MRKRFVVPIILLSILVISCGDDGGGGSDGPEAAGLLDWDFISHLNSFT